MPLASLLLPPLLLVAAAALGGGLELAGLAAGRVVVAVASWLALAVLALSVPSFASGRTLLELTTTVSVASAPVVLRQDAVTVLFGLALLTPVALLLTFQRWTGQHAAIAGVSAASALATLAAGSLVMAAFGLATCASLVLVLLRQDDRRGTLGCSLTLTGSWLLMAWAAVLLDVTGGTSAYGAVPVTALREPVLVLLALASMLCSGLLPWRTWVSETWARRRLEAGALAVALLVPLGFAPLVRAYGLAAGQLPSPWLGVALSAAGVATALGAATRAQAASSRRGFLAEAVPFAGGMALLALGLGTPLGVVAALTGVATVGAAAGLAPLAADDRGPLAPLAVAVVAGVPPALAFGGWLLSAQASLEAGPAEGFLGLVAVAAWLLALAAAARTARLPAAPPDAEAGGSPPGALVGLGVAVAGGVGLTALLALLAIPAAAGVMPPAGRTVQPVVSAAAVLGAGNLAVSTASGGWAAALLAGPLVAIGLAAAAIARWLRLPAAPDTGRPVRLVRLEAPPEPLFTPPLDGVPERALERLRGIRLPEQYRSLFRPAMLEQAVAAGRPWFWFVATVVLAIAVTR
jgi:hypothetical protein